MGYTWEGMKKLTYKEALRYFNEVGIPVYKLYDDETEACAESLEDLTSHVGYGEDEEFGVQYDDIESAKKESFVEFVNSIIYEKDYEKTGSANIKEILKKQYEISDEGLSDFVSKVKESYDTFLKLVELKF